jgi:hypothetical protein
MQKIQTTSTRFVYENRWMRVPEDTIRRRDGSTGIYGVVEKPDFVVIVLVENDRRVHLVKQYRYPVKGRYWELRKAPGSENRRSTRWKWGVRIARGDWYRRRPDDLCRPPL